MGSARSLRGGKRSKRGNRRPRRVSKEVTHGTGRGRVTGRREEKTAEMGRVNSGSALFV